MKNNRYFTGIIRESDNNNLVVFFQDINWIIETNSNDLDKAISISSSRLVSTIAHYIHMDEPCPEPSPLYKIPKQINEIHRVMFSVTIDTHENRVECNGHLVIDSDDNVTEDFWDNAYYMLEQVKDGFNSSDNFRSFKNFRNLMAITDKIKTAMHLDTLNKYNSEKLRWDQKLEIALGFASDEYKESKKRIKDPNWNVSVEVYNRLLLRYAILRDIEKLEGRYGVHASLTDSGSQSTFTSGTAVGVGGLNDNSRLNPALRAYRLATTDVFVEKAIAYLEVDSNKYRKHGERLFATATVVIIIGLLASFAAYALNYIDPKKIPELFILKETGVLDGWAFFRSFSIGFTFYGMIVLLAVGLWRLGKAMLDQAERLLDRRHALRQGRLFVHLNDGALNLSELEKAFTWNETNRNAFENIHTEASAPWGGLFKDALKAILDRFGNSNK